MDTMRRVLSTYGAAVAAIGMIVAARQTVLANTTVPVGAVVSPECIIDATPLAFGVYDPIGAHGTADLDGVGTVIVACTKGMVATVALDLGSNAEGSTRRMTSGTDYLTYELYRDAGRGDVWGDDLVGRALSLGVATSKAPQHLTVYGRVAGGQDVRAGTYLDSIVATVNF